MHQTTKQQAKSNRPALDLSLLLLLLVLWRMFITGSFVVLLLL
jgi:hypothetical protein